MSLIDILIAVDGVALASQVADGSLKVGIPSAPTSLGSYCSSNVYISMTTQSSNVDNHTQGQSELQVKARPGSIIRWTMETFGSNTDYTAYLYNGSFSPRHDMTPLFYFDIDTCAYLPATSDPTGPPTAVWNHVYVAQAMVITSRAKIQYTLSFMLIDNSSGGTIGYFSWDPFINVTCGK